MVNDHEENPVQAPPKARVGSRIAIVRGGHLYLYTRTGILMGKRKFGTCYLCGLEAALSRDHVPPKGMFLAPLPSNLVTVYSCDDCNRNSSLDEEYFRFCVIAGHSYQHPTARQIWETKVKKSLLESRGLLKRVASQRRHIYIPTSKGFRKTLNVETDRIDKVVWKIVRGLYFHHRRERLSMDVDCLVVAVTDDVNEALKETEAIRSGAPGGSFGGGAFKYVYAITIDDPEASMWWLMFYDSILFFVLTGAPATRRKLLMAGGHPSDQRPPRAASESPTANGC